MLRRVVAVLGGVLGVGCAVLALGAGSASAVLSYPFDGQLTPAGGSFEDLETGSVAVDDFNGDTYVADSRSGVVDVFATVSGEQLGVGLEVSATPKGSFGGGQVAVAANNGTGAVYVLDSADSVVDVFDSTGHYTGQITGGETEAKAFNSPYGIAVDQATGEVYVVDANNGVVDIFSVAGKYERGISLASVPGGFSAFYTRGIAVDDFNGDVFVSDSGSPNPASENAVYVFNTAGAYVTTWTGAGTPAGSFGGGELSVAADNSSGDVYVSETADGVTDVFEPAGGYLTQFSHSFTRPQGTAVDQASGRVYVSNNAPPLVVDILGPGVQAPEVVTGSAGEVGPVSATLSGSVNPDGLKLSDCHFDYVAEAEYDASAVNPYSAGRIVPCVPSAGSIPVDSTVHAVSAAVGGLAPGTTYHFRLQASTEGPGFGEDATFATPPPPSVDGVSTANLTASSVDLNARINPRGAETTYHFEWGASTAYGTSVPLSAVSIGAGSGDVPVTVHLAGLSKDQTYHWRVLAHSANGTTSSGDQTFIYDTSGGGLPDGRAYEMVTPPFKNSALIGFSADALPPDFSEDGSRVMLDSVQCFAGSGSCAVRTLIGEPFEFTRTGGGWVTTAMAPPATQFYQNTAVLDSADGGTALFSIPIPPFGEDGWYARQPDGSFVGVGPRYPSSAGAQGPSIDSVKTTADLSHVVYAIATRPELYWPFDATVGTSSLYEYVGGGNAAPALVGVSGGPGSTDLISVCGTVLGAGKGREYNALSADGGTVFFTAQNEGAGPCPSGSGVNAGVPVAANTLYARIGGSRTVRVSAGGALPARFMGASADGSRAFFREGENLYEYDFSSPAGHNLVTVSAGDSSGGGPRLQGVVAISTDGSHVYFVARGVLSGAANDRGEVARSGADNLYVFERDAGYPEGRVAFIAALPASDEDAWGEGSVGEGVGHANVTPDGRFLVFTSHGLLTADDTSATGVAQVFRYDAQLGVLVRVSIGERGFNDNGNAGAGDARIAPPLTQHAGPVRSDPTMSHDGSFVFFESPVGLTPRALDDVQIGIEETEKSGNHPVYANNVYEYHEGHVYLISDGRDTSQAAANGGSVVHLVGSDATGANVFFSTSDQLVPQDTDAQVDYYDARICSALSPCIAAPAPVSPCEGEGCRSAPEGAPSLPAAGSAVFAGAGNLAPATVKHAVKKKKRKKAKRPRRHGKGRHGKARRAGKSSVHFERGRR